MTQPKKRIFVSHATLDDEQVNRLKVQLEAATGFEFWVEHDEIALGEDFRAKIHEMAEDCDGVLLILSRNSSQRPEVVAEWNYFITLGRKLHIAKIDDLPYIKINPRLTTIQWVDLYQSWEKGIDALAKSFKGGTPLPDAPIYVLRPITGNIDPRLKTVPISGRDDDLQRVRELLQSKLTIITNIGGAGKSRLAAEIVLTNGDVGGAIWHVASDVSRADEVIELLRDHFDLPDDAKRRDILKQLKSHRRLVVIDNAESVAPSDKKRRKQYVGVIEDLQTHGAQVLMTSRADWEELDYAHEYQLPSLEIDPATKIVLDLRDALGVKRDLSPHAVEIAHAARKHPALIRFGVGLMKELPITKVLNDLKDLKSAKVEEALNEMFGKTIRQMVEAEGAETETALKRLSVYRGGFTYEASRFLLDEGMLRLALKLDFGLAQSLAAQNDDKHDALLTALQTWQFVTLRDHNEKERYFIDPLVIEVAKTDPAAGSPHYDYYKALAQQHNKSQDYYGLDVESANLDAAFAWAIENDPEDALNLANACRVFLGNRGRFGQNLERFERVASALADPLTDHSDKTLWANAQNSLGIAYQNLPTGDRHDNLRRAVAAYEAALEYRTPQAAPLDYAATQNNLGTAYSDLAGIEDREGNLRKAVAAYEAALVYYTPQAAPLYYAATQNNLGAAYSALAGIEEREGNLRKAVAAYEAALEYRTPQAAPLAYAMTQNNLGNAYRNLSEIEDREENLRKAVAAFEAALEYWTPQAAPLDYAMTQNNLGIAYADLAGTEDREGNLRKAVAAYEAALVYRTPQAAPLYYATTQNNLGTAYRALAGVEEREGNLRKAVAAYEAALVYWTPQAAPLYYATTQNNLGIAYSDLAGIEDREANLRKAVAAFEAALVYRTPQAAPLYYATTQNNLGTAYRALAGVEEREGNLRKAVAAYEAALEYRTPQAAPLDYAGTQNNLGTAYSDLAGVEDREGNLRRAVAAYEAALVYYTPQAAPLDYAGTQNNLGNAYRDLAGVEDREGNLRRAVAAYEAALEYRTPQAAPLDYAMTKANMGNVHKDLGDLPAAITCWREAEKYFRQMGYIADADLMLRRIADLEARLGGGA